MAVFFDLGVIRLVSWTEAVSFIPRCSYGFDDQNDKENKVKASIWNEEPP